MVWNSGILSGEEKVVWLENEIWGRPAFPFLVVITITPFDALGPYIAVAEASFNTSILSISSGLIPEIAFPNKFTKSKSLMLVGSIFTGSDKITPSNTHNGA